MFLKDTYKYNITFRKVIAIVLTCLFTFNTCCYALPADTSVNTKSSYTLAPFTKFISLTERDGVLALNEERALKRPPRQEFQHRAEFFYISKLIRRVFATVKRRLINKDLLIKFIEDEARKYGFEFKRFDWRNIYEDGTSFCLPYATGKEGDRRRPYVRYYAASENPPQVAGKISLSLGSVNVICEHGDSRLEAIEMLHYLKRQGETTVFVINTNFQDAPPIDMPIAEALVFADTYQLFMRDGEFHFMGGGYSDPFSVPDGMIIVDEEIEDYAWIQIRYQDIKYAIDFHRKAPEDEDIPDVDITIGLIDGPDDIEDYVFQETYYKADEIQIKLHRQLVQCAFNSDIIQRGLKQAIWEEFSDCFAAFIPITAEFQAVETVDDAPQPVEPERRALPDPEPPEEPVEEIASLEEPEEHSPLVEHRATEEYLPAEQDETIQPVDDFQDLLPGGGPSITRMDRFDELPDAAEAPVEKKPKKKKRENRKDRKKKQREETRPSGPTEVVSGRSAEDVFTPRGRRQKDPMPTASTPPPAIIEDPDEVRQRAEALARPEVEAPIRPAKLPVQKPIPARPKRPLRDVGVRKGDVFSDAEVIEVLENNSGVRLSLKNEPGTELGQAILTRGAMSEESRGRTLEVGATFDVEVVSTRRNKVQLKDRSGKKTFLLSKGQRLEGVIQEIQGTAQNPRYSVLLDIGQLITANEVTLKRAKDKKRLKTGVRVRVEVKKPSVNDPTCRIIEISHEKTDAPQKTNGPDASLREEASEQAKPEVRTPGRLAKLRHAFRIGEHEGVIVEAEGRKKFVVELADGHRLTVDDIELKKGERRRLQKGSRVTIQTKRGLTFKRRTTIIARKKSTDGTKGYPALPGEIVKTVCDVLEKDNAFKFHDSDLSQAYTQRANELIEAARKQDEFYKLCTDEKTVTSFKLFDLTDGADEYKSEPFKAKYRTKVHIYELHYRRGDKFMLLVNTQTKFRYEITALHREDPASGNIEIIAPYALLERMLDENGQDETNVFTELCLHELTEARILGLSEDERNDLFRQIIEYLKRLGFMEAFIKHVNRQFGDFVKIDLEGRAIFSETEYLGESIADFAEIYHTFKADPKRYKNSMSIVPVSLFRRYCDDVDLEFPEEAARLRPGTWTIEAFGSEHVVPQKVIDAVGADDGKTLYDGFINAFTRDSGVDKNLFSFGYTPESFLTPLQSKQLAIAGFTRLHNKGFPMPTIIGDVDPDEYFGTDDPTVVGILAYWDEDPMRLMQDGNEKTDAWFFTATSFSIQEEKIGGKKYHFPIMHAGYCYNRDNGRWEFMRFTKPVPLHYGRISGFEELVRRKFEKSGFPILEPRPIDIVTRDKSLMYKVFKGKDIRVATQLSFRRKLSTEPRFEFRDENGDEHTLKPGEARKALNDFMDRNDLEEIVVKPSDGSQGWGVRFFDTEHIEDAATYISFLARYRGVVVEERVESVPLVIDGERYDWNARVFVSRDEFENLMLAKF